MATFSAGEGDDIQIKGATDLTLIGNVGDRLKVDGSFVTQPISGTVTANAGTNLNTSLLALDTSVNGLLLTPGSTTSGQKGVLHLGAVTTAAPAYTTAQTSPLSLTTVGALRTDSSATTQPISASALPLPAGAATSANQSTIITSLSSIDAGIPAALGQTTMSASMPVTIASNQSTLPVSISSVTAGGGASFSSKTRVVYLTSTINIPAGGGYTTVFSYSGSGFLYGFNVEFNNVNITVKLVIDGQTIFDGVDISTLNGFVVTANDISRRQNGNGIVTSSSTLDWSLKLPVQYATSVVISAASSTGLIARTFNQGIIYLSKET